jgi:hypothetical protein
VPEEQYQRTLDPSQPQQPAQPNSPPDQGWGRRPSMDSRQQFPDQRSAPYPFQGNGAQAYPPQGQGSQFAAQPGYAQQNYQPDASYGAPSPGYIPQMYRPAAPVAKSSLPKALGLLGGALVLGLIMLVALGHSSAASTGAAANGASAADLDTPDVPETPAEVVAPAAAGAVKVGVYGCMMQDGSEALTLQWGILNGSEYSTFDGARGNYTYDPATEVLTFTSGFMKGLWRKKVDGVFRVWEDGHPTAISCPWEPKDPRKIHW